MRRAWPTWCVCCLLLMAGCQSVPPAESIYRARGSEESPPQAKLQFLPPTPEPKTPRPIPVSLDTVLRFAQDQNGQVRLARMKLEDAASDQVWANKHWLPDLSMGIAGYRHDGGIQDFQGDLVKSHYGSALVGAEFAGKYDGKELLYRRVEAERKVWQQ